MLLYGGQHYQLFAESLCLFGLEGRHLGDCWEYIKWLDQSGLRWIWLPEPAEPISDLIESLIDLQRSRDCRHRVARVLLNERAGLRLYLEGKVSIEHFANACEIGGLVLLPDVLFDGLALTVLIGPFEVVGSNVRLFDAFGHEL